MEFSKDGLGKTEVESRVLVWKKIGALKVVERKELRFRYASSLHEIICPNLDVWGYGSQM